MNVKISGIRFILLSVIFIAIPMPLFALPESNGEVRIHEVWGKPAEIIMPDGSKPVVRINDSIPAGTLLKTPQNSFISLLFSNGALLNMKPLSELLIGRFTSSGQVDFISSDLCHADNEPSISSTHLDLKSGQIQLDIPSLKPESNFQISTSLGIAGIRGTRLFVLSQKDRAAIGVASGRVLATSITGQTQILGPGEVVALTTTGFLAPSEADRILERELNSAFEVTRSHSQGKSSERKIPQQMPAPQSRATYKTSE